MPISVISLFPQAIAANLSYPRGTVKHFAVDDDVGSPLGAADLVIYGSFLEEQSFPEILVKAMSIGKPIITPDLSMIRKYVSLADFSSSVFMHQQIEFTMYIDLMDDLKGDLIFLSCINSTTLFIT
jgi:hypothetical protein